jgi:tetraacyldisaccharide 4'-kinase
MRPHSWFWPLSIPFQVGVQIRNRLYNLGILPSHKVDAPVISVGNISVGGTGKTPIVLLLVERLKKLRPGKGLKIAIISRGYGGTAKGTTVVSDGRRTLSDPFTVGDEPYMMAEAKSGATIIVDRDRLRGAKFACEMFKANLILLDDGFQHRRMKRDLDIVLLDGRNPLGNRLLLPAGFLREPVSSLSRAGLVVLSKSVGDDKELEERCAKLSALIKRPVIATRVVPKYWRGVSRAELHDANSIRGKRVAAFAGIAHPSSFFETVEQLGAEIAIRIPLPDHCSYGKFYLDKIAREFVLSHAEWLVTTSKDAVKLPPILRLLPVFHLEIEHQIAAGVNILDELLKGIVARKD